MLARRWRTGLVVAIAVAPALVTLTLWKSRGLGHVPLFSLGGQHLAAGPNATGTGEAATVAGVDVGKYVHLDWGHWKTEMDRSASSSGARVSRNGHPSPASSRSRRSPHNAALLGGWLAAFVVVKGFSPSASIESGSFWRLLMPAWPPPAPVRLDPAARADTRPGRLGWRITARPVTPTGRRTVAAAAVLDASSRWLPRSP